MQVTIDEQKCQGHGRCYAMAPQVYEADDEGRGLVIKPEVADGLREQAEQGIANCPESAITAS
jgi:ferredoxin